MSLLSLLVSPTIYIFRAEGSLQNSLQTFTPAVHNLRTFLSGSVRVGSSVREWYRSEKHLTPPGCPWAEVSAQGCPHVHRRSGKWLRSTQGLVGAPLTGSPPPRRSPRPQKVRIRLSKTINRALPWRFRWKRLDITNRNARFIILDTCTFVRRINQALW